jgi:DUF4097 and DUF4098 domain-containing protein YvlB
MSTFTTPGPAALTVRFASGRLVVDASSEGETPTTTVEVRAANPDSTSDVEHAAATRVEQRGETIEVIAPATKGWFGRNPRLDVRAVVPPLSRVDADVKSADVELRGDFGRVAISTASGDVSIGQVAELSARTASGDLTCRSVGGDAEITTASGDARLEAVVGSAQLSTASGDVAIGRVEGDARVRTASGDVVLGYTAGSVSARTASGDVRLGSVRTGTVQVDSASGDVEIGVVTGTAAWLDVQSLSGSVSSALEPGDAPGDTADTVSIHAHTLSGDVRIRRASNQPNAEENPR